MGCLLIHRMRKGLQLTDVKRGRGGSGTRHDFKFGVMPDTAAGAIVVLPVADWRCERPPTVFYRDDEHPPAAQREFLRFLEGERLLPDVP